MNFFSEDVVNDIVSFVFTTSSDTSAIIKNMGHLLDTVGFTDKYSKERVQIMTACIQNMPHKDVNVYHLLLEEDEHGVFQKLYAAKYRWSILRTYFIKMRPVALVLFEEWQNRSCAPGKAGFRNDCNKFCLNFHIN